MEAPVPIPIASEIALRAYHTGNLLWLIAQGWTLAVPILLLLTGARAKMRGGATSGGHVRWVLAHI